MNRRSLTFVLIAALGAGSLVGYSHAADPAETKQVAGVWTGTWEGGGSGKFDMKFEAAADGTLRGGVEVGTDGGDYKSTFSTLIVSGGKLSGRYEYPLDTQGEIVLEGSFEAGKASGTWKLVQKGGSDALFNGTWAVKKE